MKLKNKVMIVTGGNSGIGYYGIEYFLSLGATVIMASRSKPRAEEAIETLKKLNLPGQVTFMHLDLMSLASVDQFVALFRSSFQTLDVLINNAGIMFGDFLLTQDGFESQMATNHFGHFALTAKLLDLLIKSKGRIVNISSIAHRRGDMDLNNLNYQQPKTYSPWGAYSRSKLANLLFTYELDRRLKNHQIPVTVVAAHPGVSKTNLLFKNANTQPMFNVFKSIMPLQSAKQGAIPLIEAAMNPTCQGGEYFGPNGWFEFGGKQAKLVESIPLSHDKTLAKTFFDESSRLTKTVFNFNN
jgi:NAD(P)-dependent dehydrogenase (short-subunit alcohol dehydrogenase family)